MLVWLFVRREESKKHRLELQRAQRQGSKAAFALSKLEGAHSKQAAVLRRRSEHVAQLMRKLREASQPSAAAASASSSSSGVGARPASSSQHQQAAAAATATVLSRAPRGWDAARKTTITPAVLSVSESGGRVLQLAVGAAGQTGAGKRACGAMLASLAADAACRVSLARSKRVRDASIAHRTAVAEEVSAAREALRDAEAALPAGSDSSASLGRERAALASAQERLDTAARAVEEATQAAAALHDAVRRGATARVPGRAGSADLFLDWKTVIEASAQDGSAGRAKAGRFGSEAIHAVEFLLEALGRAAASAEASEEAGEEAADRFECDRSALEARAGRERTAALEEQARAAEAAVEAEARVVSALRLGSASEVEGMPSDDEIFASLSAGDGASVAMRDAESGSGSAGSSSGSTGAIALRRQVSALSAELSRMAEVQDQLLEQRQLASASREALEALQARVSRLPAAVRASMEDKPKSITGKQQKQEEEEDDEVILLSEFETESEEDGDSESDDDSDWEGGDAGGMPTVDRKRKTRPRTRRGARAASGGDIADIGDSDDEEEEPFVPLRERISKRMGSGVKASEGRQPSRAPKTGSAGRTTSTAPGSSLASSSSVKGSPPKPATKKEEAALRDIDGLLDEELTGRAKRQTALRRGKQQQTASKSQGGGGSDASQRQPATGGGSSQRQPATGGGIPRGGGKAAVASVSRKPLGAMPSSSSNVSTRPGKRIRPQGGANASLVTKRVGGKPGGALGLARAAVASAGSTGAGKRLKPAPSSTLR
jgi:hypothetical protein